MANPREIAVVLFLCLCGYSLQQDETIESTLGRLENYVNIKLDQQDDFQDTVSRNLTDLKERLEGIKESLAESVGEADLQRDYRNQVCIRDHAIGQHKSFSKEALCCSVPFSPVAGVGCVMVYTNEHNFHDARTKCNSVGAAHVVVEEADQRAALAQYLRMAYPWGASTSVFWVGVINGLWLSGAPVINQAGTLSLTTEACAMINVYGELKEMGCTNRIWSICRKIQ